MNPHLEGEELDDLESTDEFVKEFAKWIQEEAVKRANSHPTMTAEDLLKQAGVMVKADASTRIKSRKRTWYNMAMADKDLTALAPEELRSGGRGKLDGRLAKWVHETVTKDEELLAKYKALAEHDTGGQSVVPDAGKQKKVVKKFVELGKEAELCGIHAITIGHAPLVKAKSFSSVTKGFCGVFYENMRQRDLAVEKLSEMVDGVTTFEEGQSARKERTKSATQRLKEETRKLLIDLISKSTCLISHIHHG